MRAPELVKRNFTAGRPGQLHVADSTYVPLDGGGFGYTAFVIDAFAGLIAGWECFLSKETAFVERAIRAAALRARQGDPIGGLAIHYSDAGRTTPGKAGPYMFAISGALGAVAGWLRRSSRAGHPGRARGPGVRTVPGGRSARQCEDISKCSGFLLL